MSFSTCSQKKFVYKILANFFQNSRIYTHMLKNFFIKIKRKTYTFIQYLQSPIVRDYPRRTSERPLCHSYVYGDFLLIFPNYSICISEDPECSFPIFAIFLQLFCQTSLGRFQIQYLFLPKVNK
jgi:hypothetical protein